eukprot:c9685_g1_i2.p1 GENE.c9685_g1_i2~~c9685_g1_i2.p1  ORF type:complete len:439 (+),score=106.99 c9685_g1_i2:139-1317(+)
MAQQPQATDFRQALPVLEQKAEEAIDQSGGDEIEEMRAFLPAHIAVLPREEQDAYLRYVMEMYKAEDAAEKEAQRQAELFQEQLKTYQRLHPEIFTFSEDFINPETLAHLRNKEDLGEKSIGNRLYTLPLFTSEFCEKFVAEIKHLEAWAAANNVKIQRPNSMNNYGVIVDLIGMESFLDELTQRVALQIASKHFPDFGGATLNSHHGFVVEYALLKDKQLSFHVDDSEVTLNVCLGCPGFEGGNLFFRGIRCAHHRQTESDPGESVQVKHEIGTAVIHAGKHRHGALDVEAGERYNLILWCRSSTFRNEVDYSVCPSWCGHHGRPIPTQHACCSNHHHHQQQQHGEHNHDDGNSDVDDCDGCDNHNHDHSNSHEHHHQQQHDHVGNCCGHE